MLMVSLKEIKPINGENLEGVALEFCYT